MARTQMGFHQALICNNPHVNISNIDKVTAKNVFLTFLKTLTLTFDLALKNLNSFHRRRTRIMPESFMKIALTSFAEIALLTNGQINKMFIAKCNVLVEKMSIVGE